MLLIGVRRLLYCSIPAFFLCAFLQFAHAQGSTTNQGTEFWTAWMQHIDGATGINASEMDLYITSDYSTTATVSAADGSFSQTYNITANQVTIVSIPSSAYLSGSGQYTKGIHIVSAQPVVVYAHIFAQAVSGATLVLPVTALAKDYYSINYTQESNSKDSHSAFLVIATQDNTTVQITPSASLITGEQANQVITVNLNKGDVYQVLSNDDLTGSHIKSVSNASGGCQRIAVYSGSSKLYIGCPNQTSDNLFQQVYPTASWGKNYITAPLKNRDYDIFRVVLSDPATNVTINGTVVPQSNFIGGVYYEFQSTTPNIVSADKPIQLVQYAVTQGNTENCTDDKKDVGDPEMIFLIPLEQGLDHVTLYSTSNYKILANYINVILPTPAVGSFQLDGTAYNTFTAVPGNPAYSYAQIQVNSGTHNISASDIFNAIAYGFGNAESYGYAAGTNLKNLNEFIVLQNPTTDSTYTQGCTNQSYDLEMTLPYVTTSITWNFNNGTAPVTQTNPSYTTVQRGTQTLYEYHYGTQMNFSLGNHIVTATVFNPVADDCGSTEEVDFNFVISNPPVTDFTWNGQCAGSPTVFTDKTDPLTDKVKTWLWTFGDDAASAGNQDSSALQNPSHTYNKAGTYTVSLTTTTLSGCTDVQTHPITIGPRPVAGFKPSTPGCASSAITFTDASVPVAGSITAWSWIFGDTFADSTDNVSTAQNPEHTFTRAGQYTVKLVVTNSNGCVSDTVKQSITVNPLPVVNFTVPEACVDDQGAQFIDKSSIADGTETDFTYYWDFGDAQVNASNAAERTEKNPSPHFFNAGNYNVKLTVTSKYGCLHDTTIVFTLNGANPAADFQVLNANNLCSSDSVRITNLSNMGSSFGHINRIEVYWDYDGDKTNESVYLYDQNQITPQFSHSYGAFNTPVSRNYHIYMVVYSGQSQSCTATHDQTITLYANPTVTVPTIAPMCQADSPLPLVVNMGSYEGAGTFTGTGIVYQNGQPFFDPAKAAVGTNTISYQFDNNGTGCAYTTTRDVTVYATPTVYAGPDLYELSGGSVKIDATASGNNLTYKWTIGTSTATGLSADNIPDPTASVSEDTQYTLTVTSADGCSAESMVYVHVLQAPVIPNTFTPNGDGINDTWNIQYLNSYPNCTVDVYNRYGEKVYSSVGYPVPWDGRSNGANLPVGTYYYIINPKNGRKVMAGSITIIR